MNFSRILLVTFGGQVVSKMVKKFLRDHPPGEHWHISPSGNPMDTYFRLKRKVTANPKQVFSELLEVLPEKTSVYFNTWRQRKEMLVQRKNKYLETIPYSDFQVFDFLHQTLARQYESASGQQHTRSLFAVVWQRSKIQLFLEPRGKRYRRAGVHSGRKCLFE